ncbi:MAG: type II toxin-antitoxin system HicB family antitoxin [Solobacterium sp.]|nr:type II toxin-antitoxin system HicB family antitoxin [Solobacterium sp.]
MKNTLEYKGYVGSLEFSEEDSLLFGKVLGIRSLISYEGESAKELLEDFHQAVDDYLSLCEETGTEPEKPFKGSFNIRISSELHKRLFIEAVSRNMSLNSLVAEKLAAA